MVVGSVTGRDDVEAVLEKADFVSVARGMLADPYFASKVISDPSSLRPCIRCNQACRNLSAGEVRCTVNPDTGQEAYRPSMRTSGEVNIVGAGVKGLAAALTAAKAGLHVRLYEKRDGIYCRPERTYTQPEGERDLAIDSNIFQHQDAALELAGKHTVYLSERSLSSLDRSRRIRYRKKAVEKGVKIVADDSMDFNISCMERDQYDMFSAMTSGREAAVDYIRERENYSL